MSDTTLRAIINKRKHLSPKRAESLLEDLEFKLRELPANRTFEGYYPIYHTQESVFYDIGYGRPNSYFELVFSNSKFIVYVYMADNYIKLDFRENTNKLTEFDKKEVVRQLFDMFDNYEVWFSMLLLNKNKKTIIEFVEE